MMVVKDLASQYHSVNNLMTTSRTMMNKSAVSFNIVTNQEIDTSTNKPKGIGSTSVTGVSTILSKR